MVLKLRCLKIDGHSVLSEVVSSGIMALSYGEINELTNHLASSG